jgi:hypothetical protein
MGVIDALVYLRFWPDDDERLSDFNVWFLRVKRTTY